MLKAKRIEYLDERIRRLSKLLSNIKKLQDEVIPDNLQQNLEQTELLLRGFIHQLEEQLQNE